MARHIFIFQWSSNRLQAFNGSTLYRHFTGSSRVRVRQQWWDSVGAPQRALGGWQLFPFKTKKEEVQGYGFSDGATGWGHSMPDFCSIRYHTLVLKEITKKIKNMWMSFDSFEAKISEQKSAWSTDVIVSQFHPFVKEFPSSWQAPWSSACLKLPSRSCYLPVRLRHVMLAGVCWRPFAPSWALRRATSPCSEIISCLDTFSLDILYHLYLKHSKMHISWCQFHTYKII